MNHIQGIDRFQLSFSCLDDQIDKENPVRITNAFIDKLDLDLLGFVSKPIKKEEHVQLKPPGLGWICNSTLLSFHPR